MNDLATLLKVRNALTEKCSLIPTPSTSVTEDRVQEPMSYDAGYNAGLIDSTKVVMDMIGEMANFVSVCCGVTGTSKIKKIKGGGRCYAICSKCKKECKQEWRQKN